MRSRAFRRAMRDRMIAKAKKVLSYSPWNRDPEWLKNYVVRNYNHMANCSCSQCANPRTFFGEQTTQELRANDNAKSQDIRWYEEQTGRILKGYHKVA